MISWLGKINLMALTMLPRLSIASEGSEATTSSGVGRMTWAGKKFDSFGNIRIA